MKLIVSNKREKKRNNPVSINGLSEINYHSFEDGVAYRLPQEVTDKSLVGLELIVFSFSADIENGVLDTMNPTSVVFRDRKIHDLEVIHLETTKQGHMINCSWYESIYMFVYKKESKDSAILDYNSKIDEYCNNRKNFLIGQIEKELNPIKNKKVKGVTGVKSLAHYL